MSKVFVENMKEIQEKIESNIKILQKNGNRLFTNHRRIGIPTTIFTALAGATLIADIDVTGVRITIGVISLAASALSAVMTFVNFGKVAEQCYGFVHEYNQIRHSVKLLLDYPPPQEDEPSILKGIYDQLDEVQGRIQPAHLAGKELEGEEFEYALPAA